MAAFAFMRPERNDLRDVIFAVFVDHVVDDLVAAVHAEVHVDIGEGHALRIQEPLEQQGVHQRIQIGNAQGIGDEAAGGGASARADGNAARAGKLDDVPDDEEIAGEPHRADDREFFLQPQLVRHRPAIELGRSFEPRRKSVLRQLFEIGFAREAFGHLVLRQVASC